MAFCFSQYVPDVHVARYSGKCVASNVHLVCNIEKLVKCRPRDEANTCKCTH